VAIKVGEFLFAIGFGKPDTRNLERASKSAQRAIIEAQRAVAEGAEDAEEKIEAAAKAVAKHGRESKKQLAGWGHALGEVSKAAKAAASDYVAAWSKPEKLTAQLRAAAGRTASAIKMIGGAAVGAAVGLGAIVHSTTESDAELVRWSARLGVTVSELSKLEAAAMGFAEGEDVREGLQTLRENLSELTNEGTGPALESLRDLGLAADDLAGKGAAEQLAILGDAINHVGNEKGIKAALELLGGEGGKLLPFLRQGSEGMAELAAEAEALGLVVSDGAAAGSAELARELGQVLAMAKALAADVARGLMPEIRKVVAAAKDWARENGAIVKARLREWISEMIPKAVAFAETLGSIVSAGASLVESLGGMESALMIAAAGFAALQVAALGIPGAMIAASAAIAIAVNDLAGFADEFERLQKQTRALDRSRSLTARAEAGDLNGLTDEQFQAEVAASIEGAAPEDLAQVKDAAVLAAKFRAQGQRHDAGVTAARERVATREGSRVKVIEAALRKRAKKKGLGEAAVQTALTAAKQALREGQDVTGAGELAATKLDSLTAKGAGVGAGAEKIDTRAADEAFGADLRRLAERDGAGAPAVKAALEAAAKEAKGGATEGVQRAAAYAALSRATGREYKTGADGKDPLLSMILGKDVPDIEMGKLALGASPSVLQVTITNNIDARATITIPGAGSPAATGSAVADHMVGLFGSIAKAHKLAKVVFDR
jgi:hypothetical protein